MKECKKKAFSDAAMFFSLNCGEFWTKKKRLHKTKHNNLLKERKIPWKHTLNLEYTTYEKIYNGW